MARILLLTADTGHISYTRSKAALEARGHSVTGTTATTTAGLDSAWGAGFDVIATVRSDPAVASWIAAKWATGAPILLGGTELGAITGIREHLGQGLGLLSTPITYTNAAAHTPTVLRALATHPVTSGYAGDVAVTTGDNWSVRDRATPAGTPLGLIAGSAPGAYMTALDVGDALVVGGAAPARAVFCGWLYAGQSDYTVDGKVILGQAVDWLTAPPAASGAEGVVAAASTASGEPIATHAATGSVAAMATVTGEPIRTPVPHAAEGAVAAVTVVSGEPGVVTPGAAHPAGGIAAAVSAVTGEPATGRPAEGAIAAAASVSGEPGTAAGDPDYLTAESRTALRSTLAAPILVEYLSAESRTTVTSSAALWLDVTVNPSTKRPAYRLLLVDRHGESLGELPNARLGDIVRTRNGIGSFTFHLDKDDPQLHKVKQFSEVQVRIGSQLVRGAWLVIVDPKIDNGREWTFQCAGLRWHLGSRRIGKELPELLRNGDFDQDERYWHPKWFKGSAAEAPPATKIVTGSKAMEGGKALEVTGVEKVSKQSIQSNAIFIANRPYVGEPLENGFLPGGKKVITDAIKKIAKGSPVIVEGHTADADAGDGYLLSVRRAEAAKAVILKARPDLKVTAIGKGETEQVAPNNTEANQAKNRRLVIIATITSVGHRQAVTQRIEWTQPKSARRPMELRLNGWVNLINYVGPSKDGWLLYMDRRKASKPGEIDDSSHTTISETFPVERWTPDGTSILIPADGQKWISEVRLYPTAGQTGFDQFSVTPNILTAWYGITRPEAIRNLVRHAQDPEFHKADLNITTNCKPFGHVDDFEYEWESRRTVDDAIAEELRADTSPDFEIVVTDKRRIATTWAKRGRRTHVALKLGDIVTDYASGLDGDKVASTAIVQASRSRGSKGEAIARTKRKDGLVLERLFDAEQDSTVSVLRAQARAALRYGKTDVIRSVTCDPDRTLWLLERIDLGDICPVQIDDAGLNANGDYRIEEITLDPNTNRLTYQLAAEA